MSNVEKCLWNKALSPLRSRVVLAFSYCFAYQLSIFDINLLFVSMCFFSFSCLSDEYERYQIRRRDDDDDDDGGGRLVKKEYHCEWGAIQLYVQMRCAGDVSV